MNGDKLAGEVASWCCWQDWDERADRLFTGETLGERWQTLTRRTQRAFEAWYRTLPCVCSDFEKDLATHLLTIWLPRMEQAARQTTPIPRRRLEMLFHVFFLCWAFLVATNQHDALFSPPSRLELVEVGLGRCWERFHGAQRLSPAVLTTLLQHHEQRQACPFSSP